MNIFFKKIGLLLFLVILAQPSTSALSASYDRKYTVNIGYTITYPDNHWCDTNVEVIVAKNRTSIELSRSVFDCTNTFDDTLRVIKKRMLWETFLITR